MTVALLLPPVLVLLVSRCENCYRVSWHAVTNYYVNTIVTALQSSEWERLLKRVGEDVMLHLLTETSIFVALPNDCLCQVTGDMILHRRPPDMQLNDLLEEQSTAPQHSDTNLKRHHSKDPTTEPPRKRARVARQPSTKPDQKCVAMLPFLKLSP
ncbi:uncharacterized protein STEHIDRAFT_48624 [Stereum hirsutum FP-91666 SS1]|uniref:uncharacterized protein n=1 Tax=Stereum hirsutum (strain FP-91666) TaxID=721885 RepID=UPI000440E950|nr:uncharacterized protein STEHIDRAFT_48624 [Stereum hirsutum FP-91666 SS1]EIM91098.1 hypothetical protein STEHIDRAFT_48624 [Stereum hirsutum FP-91666 SS1]